MLEKAGKACKKKNKEEGGKAEAKNLMLHEAKHVFFKKTALTVVCFRAAINPMD